MSTYKEKAQVGFLLLLVLLSGVVYISLNDQFRLRVDNDKSTFYVKNGVNVWTVAGREYNNLFDGSSKMNRDISGKGIQINTTYFDNSVIITRRTHYIRGPVIQDTYFFLGNLSYPSSFPIYHTVEIFNGSGYFYRYEVRDLSYFGSKKKLDLNETSHAFGKNMKVEWQPGFRWAWVYSSGIVKVQYDISTNYEKYEVRLFDPLETNLSLNGQFNTVQYELGTPVEINYTADGTVCIDIDHPDYGYNYSCESTGTKRENITISSLYYRDFENVARNITVNDTFSSTYILADNISIFNSSSIQLAGVGDPENVTLDIGNDGDIDFILFGFLGIDHLTISRMTNGLINEILSFSGSNEEISRSIDFNSQTGLIYNGYLITSGNAFIGNFSLGFGTNQYKETSLIESIWNTSNDGELHMDDTIQPNDILLGSGVLSRRVYDSTTCDEVTESSVGTGTYTLFCNFDDDTSTASVINWGDCGGCGTREEYWVAEDYSTSDTLNVKYRNYVELGVSSIGYSRHARSNLSIYDWDNNKWETIDFQSVSCSSCGSLVNSDSGVTTWTKSLASNTQYVNGTGHVKFRESMSQTSGACGSCTENTKLWLYHVGESDTIEYDTRQNQSTTTKSLFQSTNTVTNVTLYVNTSQQGTDVITAWLSSNDGSNYKKITTVDGYTNVVLTTPGINLKLKFELGTSDQEIRSAINFVTLYNLTGQYPENITFDIGGDGDIDFFNNSQINESLRVYDLGENTSQAISSYIVSNCQGKYTESCAIPFRIVSATSGDLNVTFEFNVTKTNFEATDLTLNLTDFENECTTRTCSIPINISWIENNGDANVTLRSMELEYVGEGNVTFTSRDQSTNENVSRVAEYYYANWNYTFPKYISYLEFIPKKPTQANVSPFGQTNNIPILNFTMLNLGSKQMNFSMLINESYSCVNLTISLNKNKSSGIKLTSGTWVNLSLNKDPYTTVPVWMFADLGCNATSWQLWEPEFFFRGCSDNTICSSEYS